MFRAVGILQQVLNKNWFLQASMPSYTYIMTDVSNKLVSFWHARCNSNKIYTVKFILLLKIFRVRVPSLQDILSRHWYLPNIGIRWNLVSLANVTRTHVSLHLSLVNLHARLVGRTKKNGVKPFKCLRIPIGFKG